MPRLRTLAEWLLLLVPLVVIGFLGWHFLFAGGPETRSGLPDATGGFYQSPAPTDTFSRTMGPWEFTLTSSYTYTVAGRIVGRQEYPAAPPGGIIPLDLAIVNGDLVRNSTLSFFSFSMGNHTLTYSYDIPKMVGLTEDYIDEHVSNNHLVFRNETLEQEAETLGEGSCVVISGRLADILGTSGRQKVFMNTSTVRNDSYPEGCEIILVDSFRTVSCGE